MTPPPRPPEHAPVAGEHSLPRQLTGFQSPIVWGAILLVVIEATIASLFVVSYFYLRLGAPEWPPAGTAPPELLEPTVAQLLLLLSPVPVWVALRPLARDRAGPLLWALPLGLLLAFLYLALQVRSYLDREDLWNTHAYGSLNWSMGGYAGLHVVTVLLAGSVIWALAKRGHFGARRHTGVQALLVYWIFVAVSSLFFYATQYLAPRI